ncbi:dicarboxylate/amino acid:cation symporter [Desertibacillus haloalkaliphilus]|uniref:dicarboxylate/amino acid:cation symporter n=1 Tax=Desertibacillus haloalkaliphilus TaxID=1328930 RepID=UPI001C27C49B|nr:dicarboxylate/amino acid:cation symporter [Desertibacillus haloalkaliphilus]MBU8905502.1 dicarboxylate/amino acid:cation symporter [Desertibacillus haloalkaliphilus]
MKLILKLLVGIIAGILIGLVGPEFIVRLMITIKTVFGSFIGFIIPFIILFFIASGVAGLGQRSGGLVGKTVGVAYLSTFLAGIVAFFVASIIIPNISSGYQSIEEGTAALEPLLNIEFTPLMGVVTALITAFVFGIGVAKTGSATLKSMFDEGKKIIDLVISKIIIPFLPLYIAGIFAELAYEGTVFETLKVFGVVLVLAICTHWLWIIIQYITAGSISKRNPFQLLKNMLPAYFTALGTMSSAATIPVTLRSTKQNRVKEDIANFVVPLSANIHLSGSVITIVTCTVAVMTLTPELAMPSFTQMIPFILMLGVIMVAAPGVPGGAIMAATGVLMTMFGFNEAAIGLMIALYMAQDSFGTATNVTGDGAISVIVDQVSEKSK